VSLDVVDLSGFTHWDTAGTVASRLLDWMCGDLLHTVINCNVPNLPIEILVGIRRGILDLLGTFQTSITEQSGKSVPTTYAEPEVVESATDSSLLREGFASVTALVPVVADTEVDFKKLFG
jgi:hypothetical protein